MEQLAQLQAQLETTVNDDWETTVQWSQKVLGQKSWWEMLPWKTVLYVLGLTLFFFLLFVVVHLNREDLNFTKNATEIIQLAVAVANLIMIIQA